MLRELVLDNPVLVKHLRSRLRPQHLVPLVAVVVVLAGCVIWGGLTYDAAETALIMLLVGQGALLFLAGTAQVASAVARARESGMLDFHRISPQPPTAIALGFLLGAPIREWVLFACTLPGSFILAAMGGLSLLHWFLLLVEFVAVALLYHAAGLIAGLAFSPRTSNAVLVIIVVVLSHFAWAVQPVGFLTVVPLTLAFLAPQEMHLGLHFTFMGTPVHPMLLSLLHQVPIFVFLFVAATRKMRHELAYGYTKTDAVMFFGVLAALLLGDSCANPVFLEPSYSYTRWTLRDSLLTVTYGLLAFGLCLSLAVTPTAGPFAKGIRHARKLGLPRAPAWSDFAANWPVVIAFAGILLAAGVAAMLVVGEAGLGKLAPVAVGVCALVCFACGKQAFELLFPKNATAYFLLLLFALWVFPLLIGALLAIPGGNDALEDIVLALSPLAGIALVAPGQYAGPDPVVLWVALASSVITAAALAGLCAYAIGRARQTAGEAG